MAQPFAAIHYEDVPGHVIGLDEIQHGLGNGIRRAPMSQPGLFSRAFDFLWGVAHRG